MKASRSTIGVLLAAAVAVWGVVAWKIFAPVPRPEPAADPRKSVAETPIPGTDTLRMDYADPFLKGTTGEKPAVRPPVRTLTASKAVREKVRIEHLGTIRSGGRSLYILTIDDTQYELAFGASARGFVLARCDGDSLYLRKKGVRYGVKRCER